MPGHAWMSAPGVPINVLACGLPLCGGSCNFRFRILRWTRERNKSQVDPAGFDLHLPEWLNTPPAKARFAALRVRESPVPACDPPMLVRFQLN